MKPSSYNRAAADLAHRPPFATRFCYIDDGELRGFGHVRLAEEPGRLRAQLLDRVFPWNGMHVPTHARVILVDPVLTTAGSWFEVARDGAEEALTLAVGTGGRHLDCWWKPDMPFRLKDAPPVVKLIRLRMCTSAGKQYPMYIEPGSGWHDDWTGGKIQPIYQPTRP